MRTGDAITIQIDQGPVLPAVVDLSSTHSRSIAVSTDEGIPHPFHIDKQTGRQVMLLMQMGTDTGLFFDAMLPQRIVRVTPQT